MSAQLKASLPELYQQLLPSALLDLNVEQKRSTCNDCAMCNTPEFPGGVQFAPSAKCCTFWPSLPNYLVGSLLADRSGRFLEGQRRMRAQIQDAVTATPFGVGPADEYLERLHANRAAEFGRNENLLCPYFERTSGGCTIWAHRDSDCTSFFCKFENGRHFEFWRQFGATLALIERGLSVHAKEVVEQELNFESDPERFYILTYSRVSQLTAEQLPSLLGEPWQRRQQELARAVDQLVDPEPPKRIRLARGLTVLKSEALVSVQTYNEYDPLVVPGSIFSTLENSGEHGVPLAELSECAQALLNHEVVEGV